MTSGGGVAYPPPVVPHPHAPLQEHDAATICQRIAEHVHFYGVDITRISCTPHPAGLVIGGTLRGRTVHVVIPPGWKADYAVVAKALIEEARNGQEGSRLITGGSYRD